METVAGAAVLVAANAARAADVAVVVVIVLLQCQWETAMRGGD